jgi:hypothetical protein
MQFLSFSDQSTKSSLKITNGLIDPVQSLKFKFLTYLNLFFYLKSIATGIFFHVLPEKTFQFILELIAILLKSHNTRMP